jgi:hypothetical protein
MTDRERRVAVGEPTHEDLPPDTEGDFADEHENTDLVDRDRRLRDAPDEPESPNEPGGMDM